MTLLLHHVNAPVELGRCDRFLTPKMLTGPGGRHNI